MAELLLTKRLEPFDPRHSNTVAMLCGPLVLFAIMETAPALTRAQSLSAAKVAKQHWQVKTAGAPLSLLPFTAISGEPYTTYLVVSG
jgi:uncharacterized protein